MLFWLMVPTNGSHDPLSSMMLFHQHYLIVCTPAPQSTVTAVTISDMAGGSDPDMQHGTYRDACRDH